MNIGFIGLGNMGSGMASNLATYCQANDHSLLVFDLNTDAMDKVVAQGAQAAESIPTLATQVELVFTSLPSSKQIEQVARGDDGLFAHLPEGAVWFETSTNEIESWECLKREAPDHLQLVDAPVTGGAEGAAAGTLTMLLGIDEDLLERFAPLLASFTDKAMRMGPSGAGYATKLCQLHLNYLAALGIGEAMMLGAKSGIDLQTLYGVLQTSCAQSYVVDSYIPKVLDGSYDPSFPLGLATKDIRLINNLGKHHSVELPLANEVLKNYEDAVSQFGEGVPHLQVLKLIENDNDHALR